MTDETRKPKFAEGQEVMYGEVRAKIVAYDPQAGYTVIAPTKATVQEDALAALPEHQA